MKKVKIEIFSIVPSEIIAEVEEAHDDGMFRAKQQFSRHGDALAWVSKWVDICKGMRDIYAVEFADYAKDDFRKIELGNDIVYINGIKASQADISRLVKDMASGLQAIYHYTKSGALAFVTNN